VPLSAGVFANGESTTREAVKASWQPDEFLESAGVIETVFIQDESLDRRAARGAAGAGEIGMDALRERGIDVRTVGRSAEEDPEFFLAAGAAGAIAAEGLRWAPSSSSD
jgi:hypothetical protein